MTKLQSLSRQIAELTLKFMDLKADAVRRGDESVITYRVRRTKVKAHVRRGYRAIRLNSF